MTALEAMRAALGEGIFADAADMPSYLTDWRGSTTGAALAVLLPRTTEDVQTIVRVAEAEGVALVPQGGNTGMVAGAVPNAYRREAPHGRPAARSAARTRAEGPDQPAMVVSLKRMNRILSVDASALSREVEAGAILAHVHEAALAVGCRFPLSLGAKGSATVGGLVSTNAGGTQVLRHGNMRQLVLGLEAVMAGGELLHQLSALRKDNSGYDVKQLLIGGEGTLGIVTRVALKLAPEPAERAVGWAGVADPAHALKLLARLRGAAGETVESFEIIEKAPHDLVVAHLPGARSPLAGPHNWHVLIELAGAPALLEELLGAAIEGGEVEDAVVARSGAQAEALWALREGIPEAERRDGKSVKSDISVAVADVAAFHAAAVQLICAHFPTARPLVFGHLGDGNLHWNIRPPLDEPDWAKGRGEEARAMLHDLVTQWHGSISAEHGIGALKSADLARLADPAKLHAMRAVKAALDPAGIFNPGKIFG